MSAGERPVQVPACNSEARKLRTGLTIVDPAREPHRTPCADCGRTYLQGENITVTVPTAPTGTRVVWSGCVDCWLVRTDPAQAAARADFLSMDCPGAPEDRR